MCPHRTVNLASPAPPRRRLAQHALQCLALGLGGLQSARSAQAQGSRPGMQLQWLPGQALQTEDPACSEWQRCEGDSLVVRVRSFRALALWVAPGMAAPSEHRPARLGQLRWNCALQAGVRMKALTLRAGSTVLAHLQGAPLLAQRLSWPEGLSVQQGLMLRWELQAEDRDRELAWQHIELEWM